MNQELTDLFDDLEQPERRLGAIEELARRVSLTVTVGVDAEARKPGMEARSRWLEEFSDGQYLDDPDRMVRAMTLGLWDLMRAQEKVRDEVLSLLKDSDRMVRSTAVFAAVRFQEVDPDSQDVIRRGLSAEDLGERYASAFFLAMRRDESDRVGVAKALLEGAAEASTLKESLKGCPFLDDGIPDITAVALSKLGPVPGVDTRGFIETMRDEADEEHHWWFDELLQR